MSSTVSAFGVKEYSSATSEVERAVEDIRITGDTVLSGVLSADELAVCRTKLHEVYARQVEEVGAEDRLHLIHDAYTARCPLAYDDFFLRVATHPRVLDVVAALLGDYYIIMLQNGLLNVPDVGNDQNAGQWHRDLNYQHFVSTRPLSISALFCIDRFSAESGGTMMLPGSHKHEPFPSEDYVRAHETPIDAEPGAVLVFDSMIYHRGGLNRTAEPRRAINHMYTLPLLRQQISVPKLLGGRYQDDPFLRRFLGYEIETPDSVRAFREERIARVAQ
jgi:ectoine hydroxylase-related dioxygenase (phytanoyl-CoA dioxygenase family)